MLQDLRRSEPLNGELKRTTCELQGRSNGWDESECAILTFRGAMID